MIPPCIKKIKTLLRNLHLGGAHKSISITYKISPNDAITLSETEFIKARFPINSSSIFSG